MILGNREGEEPRFSEGGFVSFQERRSSHSGTMINQNLV